MVEPTLIETLVAAFAVVVFGFVIFALIAGISLRVVRAARRLQSLNAERDVQILMAENLHLHRDPTAPDAEYGAVNEAREMIGRRR